MELVPVECVASILLPSSPIVVWSYRCVALFGVLMSTKLMDAYQPGFDGLVAAWGTR